MKNDAFAVNLKDAGSRLGQRHYFRRIFTSAFTLTGFILAVAAGPTRAANAELDKAVDDLQTQINTLIAGLQIKLRTDPMTFQVGSLTANKGSTISLPVTFNSGATPVSTAQFDLVLPPGVSSGTVTAGAAATAAGKSVQSSFVGGTLRVLIFGLNQTGLSSGVVANVGLKISSTAASGIVPVRIANVTGADGDAANANVSGTSGAISVN